MLYTPPDVMTNAAESLAWLEVFGFSPFHERGGAFQKEKKSEMRSDDVSGYDSPQCRRISGRTDWGGGQRRWNGDVAVKVDGG